jgi:hypothetical protein
MSRFMMMDEVWNPPPIRAHEEGGWGNLVS